MDRSNSIDDIAVRCKAARDNLVQTAERLAVTEDRAADLFDDLAARRPDRAEPIGHLAERARAGARRAREIADHFSR
ncbi:hypothetical protein GZH49_14575 [Nocardia terpenica]|uniref:hypothetical protein n=1 Tax=Nocardia terpenica TaxID=455432 RepID=UPI002FE0D53F